MIILRAISKFPFSWEI